MSTPAPSTSTVPTASPGTPRSTTSHAFSTPAIALSDLRKTFGAVQAVNGLDLSVGPGEVVAFLGPNGAGKSTTLDMVLGLTQPTSGTVRVLGSTPRRAVAQGRIGAVLQDGGLTDNFTVAETAHVAHTHQDEGGHHDHAVDQLDGQGQDVGALPLPLVVSRGPGPDHAQQQHRGDHQAQAEGARGQHHGQAQEPRQAGQAQADPGGHRRPSA